MIVSRNGRYRSTRTVKEDLDLLKREMTSLSPEEREALSLLLKEQDGPDQEQPAGLLHAVEEAEYLREPVDVETFVRDEYYLGNTCDALYDVHLRDLKELFSGGYHEAIWTGSLGAGKTFAASVAICRLLYEISCLRDPHRSYGLARGSNISIVCLSINESLAMRVAFENIASKLQASPYFQQHFPFKATRKEFRFPSGVWLAARATTDTSALGLNIVGSFVDEANFMKRHTTKLEERLGAIDQAERLYTIIRRRMKSRFERNGHLPGLLVLVSSKKSTDDFTARRIMEARNDPTVFTCDYTVWDVRPADFVRSRWFKVLCGNDQVPSKILSPEEIKRLEGAPVPDGIVVLSVPEEFRPDFEQDLEGSIRDIGGISTSAISIYIQRRDKLVARASHPHPFSVEVWDPSKPGGFLWDTMVRPAQVRDFGGERHEKLRPILNPQAPRHIHIDPSYRKDSTGFCMAHIGGWKDVIRRSETGEVYQERAPIIVVDLILRIVPPVGDEIVLGDIRRLIYELADHGYHIEKVTQDTWNSVDMLQQLKLKGFDADHLSVDTRTAPYDVTKEALYEDRLVVYDYKPLFYELARLQKDEKRNKIDHQPKGRKDVSDSLAGVVYTLATSSSSEPLPMVSDTSYAQDDWMDEHMHASELARAQHPDRFYPPVAGRREALPVAFGSGDDGDERPPWE